MTNLFHTLLLVLAAAFALAKGAGDNDKALFVFVFVAVPIVVSWFFVSRRQKSPSKFETAFANIWLVVRRTVCTLGALLFCVTAAMTAFSLYERAVDLSILERIFLVLFMFAMAFFCVWVGVFGQGSNRYAWRDDVALHNENKRRYHWRW